MSTKLGHTTKIASHNIQALEYLIQKNNSEGDLNNLLNDLKFKEDVYGYQDKIKSIQLMDDLLNALEFEYYTPFRIWKKLQCREYNTHAYASIPEDIKEFLCYFIDYRHVSYVAEYFNYFEIVFDLYIASEIKYNNSSIRSTIDLIQDRFTTERDGVEFNLFYYPKTLHQYKPIQEYFASKCIVNKKDLILLLDEYESYNSKHPHSYGFEYLINKKKNSKTGNKQIAEYESEEKSSDDLLSIISIKCAQSTNHRMSKEVFKGIYKSKDRYMQANQYLKSLKFLGHVDLDAGEYIYILQPTLHCIKKTKEFNIYNLTGARNPNIIIYIKEACEILKIKFYKQDQNQSDIPYLISIYATYKKIKELIDNINKKYGYDLIQLNPNDNIPHSIMNTINDVETKYKNLAVNDLGIVGGYSSKKYLQSNYMRYDEKENDCKIKCLELVYDKFGHLKKYIYCLQAKGKIYKVKNRSDTYTLFSYLNNINFIGYDSDKSILVKPMFLFEDKLEKALIACSGNLPLTIKKEDFHITSRESGSIWNKLFMFKAYTEVPKSLLIELLKKIGQKIYIEINIKK